MSVTLTSQSSVPDHFMSKLTYTCIKTLLFFIKISLDYFLFYFCYFFFINFQVTIYIFLQELCCHPCFILNYNYRKCSSITSNEKGEIICLIQIISCHWNFGIWACYSSCYGTCTIIKNGYTKNWLVLYDSVCVAIVSQCI